MTCWKSFETKPKKGEWIEVLAVTHIDCLYDPDDEKNMFKTTHLQTEKVLWRNLHSDNFEEEDEEEKTYREIFSCDW